MTKEEKSELEQKARGVAYSAFKIFHPDHRKKLNSFLEERVLSPVHVRVKPTNKCNHDCTTCAYHFDSSQFHPSFSKKDEIPREKMIEILSDFADIGVKAITYSGGGEPLVYPHIIEALEQTINYGIDFAMNTNGQELNGVRAELLSNASWVRVSANAIEEETFTHLRRHPKKFFHELISNINGFVRIKPKSCNLGINFVVHKENVSTIYQSIKFFKELGVNNIKFTPVWSPDFFEYHKGIITPVVEQINEARETLQNDSFQVYDTYKQDFELTGTSERTYNICPNMQVMPAIGADCGVYACFSKAYDPSGLIGSLKSKSFKSLWFSKEAAEFFKSFNPRKLCKHQCPCDEKNIMLINFFKNKNLIDIPQDILQDINFA